MPEKRITIALTGNPNAGKSTVFNAITGARQHIANYPGVTVEKKSGTVLHKGREIEVVDLPGTYSLTAYSLEEIVARDFLLDERPDLVVDIIDASNLDRNLYLTVQLLELGIPVILALNMVDLAASKGLSVDGAGLASLIDVPVIPMVARTGKGIGELLDTVVTMAQQDIPWRPVFLSYGLDIDQGLREIEDLLANVRVCNRRYPVRWCAVKCLEGDRQFHDLLARDPGVGPKVEAICTRVNRHLLDTLEEDAEGIIADHRYGFIAGITKKVLKREIHSRRDLSDRIDRVLTNRIIGPLFMVGVLYMTYAFTFWASELPLRGVEVFFEALKGGVSRLIPEGPLQSLLVSGVLDGVGGVLGFVPLILFMFFAIAILEDSGYMARISFMLDRVLRWFGLHGNSVISLIVSGGISGGCAVPGVMATRTLRDPKERIATLLVVPMMNCGAKIPIFALFVGTFFTRSKAQVMFLLTLLAWLLALLSAKLLRATVLRGPKTPFVMELPPYRAPTLQGLCIHTWERTWQYIKKAGTVILGFSLLLWAAMTFPGLSDEARKGFAEERARAGALFLETPGVTTWVRTPEDLPGLAELFVACGGHEKKGSWPGPSGTQEDLRLPLVRRACELRHPSGDDARLPPNPGLETAARACLTYLDTLAVSEAQEAETHLKRTAAGFIGHVLESITRPLGFDYRVNVALLSGFAAKEMILSSLGTAYSLSERASGRSLSLAERLRQDPRWNPLQALTLIIFIMLYVPCVATLISIRKETTLGWTLFAVLFNFVMAYVAALGVRHLGMCLGLAH